MSYIGTLRITMNLDLFVSNIQSQRTWMAQNQLFTNDDHSYFFVNLKLRNRNYSLIIIRWESYLIFCANCSHAWDFVTKNASLEITTSRIKINFRFENLDAKTSLKDLDATSYLWEFWWLQLPTENLDDTTLCRILVTQLLSENLCGNNLP